MTEQHIDGHTRRKKGGQRKCVKVGPYTRRRVSNTSMKLITLHLTPGLIQALDDLVPEFYPNRAEAIRAGIRDLLAFHARMKWRPKRGN